jgi:PAS domain S-box-containing protein
VYTSAKNRLELQRFMGSSGTYSNFYADMENSRSDVDAVPPESPVRHADHGEAERLATLHRYAILDTPEEEIFENITRILAQVFEAPMSAVSLVAADRQWFKAQVGMDIRETPLAQSICHQAISRGGRLVVNDTLEDRELAANPLVSAQGGIRFYAGEPLCAPNGHQIGMLCVLDSAPRPAGITPRQALVLRTLADLVIGQLELRRLATEQAGLIAAQRNAAADLRQEKLRSDRLNAALQAQVEERTRERDMLWDISEDLLVNADYVGTLLRVSRSWTTLFGMSELELLGGGYMALIHPDDLEHVGEALAVMQRDGHSMSLELRVRDAAGLVLWISWTLTPEPGGQRFTGIGRNITEAKAKNAEMMRMEETLRQSQKMEAVGQLTGGLAHDFNNLLAGIMGALELMRLKLQMGRTADIERYIAIAHGAGSRAAALTHRLLAFSRRQTLDPKATDVNALMQGMTDLIQRTIGPSIAMEVVCASDLWPTMIDPSQLENALLNLCINARDAMPDGGRLILETANQRLDPRSAAEHGLAPGEYICVGVRDTGTGMSADTVSRAFEPFFTTKPTGEGTGLGLSMVYGFARQSGGEVRIRSAAGRGTTMTLYLPRTVQRVAAAPSGATALAGHGHGECVLVVEDESSIRALIIEVLEEAGYRTAEAVDGPSALRILQSPTRVDLLVTDVGLPGGMNGRQVADAGRVTRPALKVLFITGYAENATVGNGSLGAGMQILTKPFRLQDLSRRIHAMLQAP